LLRYDFPNRLLMNKLVPKSTLTLMHGLHHE
jgi:hypothetical protein